MSHDDIRAALQAATIIEAPGYMVRADGSVWSERNWRGQGLRQIVPIAGKDGYLKVRLSLASGRRINRAVHRIVAEAFLGERPPGTQVRHLNGDRLDNRALNLRYGSAKENAQDRDRHGRTVRGEKSPNARLADSDISVIRTSSETQRALASQYGVSQRTILRVLQRKVFRHVA